MDLTPDSVPAPDACEGHSRSTLNDEAAAMRLHILMVLQGFMELHDSLDHLEDRLSRFSEVLRNANCS
jgi:hypothetical protein